MGCRVAAMLLMVAAAAPAAALPPAASCELTAYLADRDPAGLNVRAGPSARTRVLRRIDSDLAGVASLREHRGGWFRVARIVDAETDAVLFEGDGWVHGSLLGLDVANADPRLYSAADSGSRTLATLRPDETPLTLIGCSGAWARVRAAGRTGWLSPSGQCSNPLTTCA